MRNVLKVILILAATSFSNMDAAAIVTNWVALGSNQWADPDSWSNGVPEEGDSAIIDIDGDTVLIIDGYTAKAAYVFIGPNSVLFIEEFGKLLVTNSPARGINIRGNLSNTGEVSVSDCGGRGIDLAPNFGSSVVNEGVIKISHSGATGLILNSDATFQNNGFLSVLQGGMFAGSGIDIIHTGNISVFTNHGTVAVDSTVRSAIFINGRFENSGAINIRNAALLAASIIAPQAGILVDSTRYSGSFDAVGEMNNSGHITIDKSGGIGLFMDLGTDLTNNSSGTIEINGCAEEGMVTEPYSISLFAGPGSLLEISDSGGTPLELSDHAEFSIENSATLDVNL